MKHRNKDIREIIVKEIKEIAPLLSSLDKSNPYHVDQSYFKNLEDKVYEQTHTQNPYEVKVDYFNTLSDSIMEKVEAGNKVGNSGRKLVLFISGIAATFLLLITATVFLKQVPTQPQHTLASTELYLEENIEDLSIEDMITNDTPSFTENIPLISPEDMEAYIEENIEDFYIEDLAELL